MRKALCLIVLLPSLAIAQTSSGKQVVSDVGALPATVGGIRTTMAKHTAGWVSVADFGARGDGSTDDTAAIQAAINVALANGGDVFLPPVSRGAYYKITKLYFQYDAANNPGAPSTSSQSRPVRLRGVGAMTDLETNSASDWARSLLVSTDATGPALVIDGAATGYSSRQVEIEGVSVIAANSTFVVSMRGANTGSTLRRCLFQQNGTGGGVDWDTPWMMGLSDTIIQSGALAMTTGSVGLRMRWNGVGGGPNWAHGVFVQRAYQQKTTGSITSGTATLALASAIDFQNGQAIQIQGAGAGGNWLETTISGGAGSTTLTLADNAGTTVAAASTRHGGGFDIGIQIGGQTGETGYDYFAAAVDFRNVVSQWNRTGLVLGGRPSQVLISHAWTEGNRKQSVFIGNRASQAKIEHAYLNDIRASDGGVVIDSATSGTATYGLALEDVWFPTVHNYGVKFVDGTYTSGRISGCRFTKDQGTGAGSGIGIYTGGFPTPWLVEANIYDGWSGLTSYDNAGAIKFRSETTGVISPASVDTAAVANTTGASALTVAGNAADGSNSVGVIVDNATSLTASGTALLSIRNAGVEKARFNKDGSVNIGASLFIGTTSFQATGGLTTPSSDASVAVKGTRVASNNGSDVILQSTVTRTAGYIADVTNNATRVAGFDFRGGVKAGKADGTGVAGPAVYFGTAAPGSGAYVLGDRVLNSSPAVGQPKSWVCTVAGSPGTWVSEGNL